MARDGVASNGNLIVFATSNLEKVALHGFLEWRESHALVPAQAKTGIDAEQPIITMEWSNVPLVNAGRVNTKSMLSDKGRMNGRCTSIIMASNLAKHVIPTMHIKASNHL